MSMADKEEEESAVKAEEEKELPRPPLVGRRDIRPLELRVKSEPMPDLEVLHNFGSSLDSNISVLRSPENARQRFLRRAVSESVGTTSSPAGDRDAASQIRRERGFSFEEPVQFLEPLEGTPAYMALEANKNIKMNAVNKLINKSMSFGGIRPKLKNLKKLNLTGKKKYRRFSRNFKGNVIDGVHELYTLTAGMMLGIRCAATSDSLRTEKLRTRDFEHVHRLVFPKEGSSKHGFNTPPHSLGHTFKFKSYAPKVFENIRQTFDIDTASYMLSVCGNFNFLEFISNSKSGQFFFYSHDGKYMIKTQSQVENKFLMKILPDYYQYIRENPNTLLVRMLGLYRVNMYHLRRKVRFVIMASVFDTPEKIHTIYDLKGSLLGREATEKERLQGGVLKDMDLVREKRFIHLGPKKADFLKQVTLDAEFLASLNIMDYSLLIGIHDRLLRTEEYTYSKSNHAAAESQYSGTGVSSSVGPVLGVNASGYGAHSNTPFRTSVHFQSPHDMATIAEESPPVGGVAPGRRVSSLDDYEKGPYGSVPNPNSFRGANDTLTISQHPDHDKLRRSSGSQDEVTPKRRESNSLSLNSDVDGNKKDNSSSPARRKSVFAALFGSKLFSPPPAAKEVAHIDEADSMPGIPKLDDSYDENEESCSEDSSEMSELNDENIDDGDEVPTPICNPSPTNSIWRRLSLSSGREERTYESGPIERTRNPWTQRKDGGINSRVLLREHGNEIYYVGIIDILQQYNFRKKTENFVKGFSHDRSIISAVDAATYAKRFIQFLHDNID